MNLSITFQQVDIDMNIIYNNPYRILGVYANSRRQEIIANKGKATAFLKVGKVVKYPLDLKGILPPIVRSVEILSEAESHLSLAKEQLKYVQFWFLKMTPLDDVAFNHLIAGNITGAEEIWSKQDSLSSLQNKIVCYLIEDNLQAAVIAAEMLYEKYGDTYINKVDVYCTLQMPGSELLHLFLDSLGEEIGYSMLIGLVSGEDAKFYIKSKTIGPLISKISSEVERTKKVDHNDAKARIEAARNLVTNTREPFAQLKSILPSTDSQFQMIADKLGLEMLQCGIDYYNNSDDDDAPQTAMKIQKYAQSIVIGKLAKQRCEENVKTLEKIIEELPPKEVVGDNNAILNRITSYSKSPKNISNAIMLLNDTKQYLQNIKNELGAKDPFYLKLSTIVVSQALHGVVVEVNESQKPIEENIGLLTYELPSYFLTPEQKQKMVNRIKNAVSNAWYAIVAMDQFDLENSFKQHYYQNRKAIKSMCEQFGIQTSWEPLPIRRFAEYGGFWSYIKSAKSSRWQAALSVTIIGGIIGFLIYYNNPSIYDVDEKFKCIAWGTGIGAIAWFCILVDNDNKSGDWGDLAARGGCYGVILFLGLFLFYWVYKIIRLSIDGIKRI